VLKREKRSVTYQPKNKSDGDGKVCVASSDNSDSDDFLVFFVGRVLANDEWILDSAFSYML
jgi:hypothetical protein